MKINPYINLPGTTEEAFNFYKSVFGGEFLAMIRFKDMPMPGHEDRSEDDLNKIMHVALPIGDGNILMGTDATESMGQKLTFGNNFYISITADSKDKATGLYNGLSNKGKIESPIGDSPWGSYFGMFKDKYGIGWMVSYDYPKE